MLILNLILLFINLVDCNTKNNFENGDDYLDFIEKPINILVSLYFGTRSHIKFMLEINQHLQNLGHNVTLATPEEYLKWADGFNITKISMGNIDQSKFIPGKGLAGILPQTYDQFYPQYKGIIEDIKPDVVICDFFSAACVDYCQENRIPLIVGLQALDSRLNPIPYINNNAGFNIPVTTERMLFLSRWYNTFIRSDKGYKERNDMRNGLNKARAKYGISPRKGRWGDFDTTYKMLNTYAGWEVPRPLHPTIDLIGPIRSVNIPPLTDDLTKFLEKHNSIMYIAFGTRIRPSKLDLELIIQSSFLALNNNVINGIILATTVPKTSFPEEIETVFGTIKTEDLFNGEYTQFKLASFVPQESILKHKSTKLFMSHGGLESMFETIFTSTPVIVIPFGDDQPINAQLVIENNLGGMIDKGSDSPTKIFEEIRRIVADEDGSIKRDLKRVRTIAHFKSIGLQRSGEKIITFAKVAKACKTDKDSKDEIPCELKHMITVDQKISHFKAYQWDIYIFHYSFVALIIAASIHFGIKLYFKLKSRGYSPVQSVSDTNDRYSHSD